MKNCVAIIIFGVLVIAVVLTVWWFGFRTPPLEKSELAFVEHRDGVSIFDIQLKAGSDCLIVGQTPPGEPQSDSGRMMYGGCRSRDTIGQVVIEGDTGDKGRLRISHPAGSQGFIVKDLTIFKEPKLIEGRYLVAKYIRRTQGALVTPRKPVLLYIEIAESD